MFDTIKSYINSIITAIQEIQTERAEQLIQHYKKHTGFYR